MRKTVLWLATAFVALGPVHAAPARAADIVSITASPNPAVVGDKVVHVIRVWAYAPLDVWVSAEGFDQPRLGTLPSGSWHLECCPTQTRGAPAWHYRSSSIVVPGKYRFGARARARGTYASTAALGSNADVVWMRIT